ncbi:ABC transporter permease [Pararhizobium sp. IMCC21322]|uniref:ABC transporter permease n=1 Tax=Pararhizobium sp. IMCC21322 TaxID=3067903 RepID=UPI002741EAE3|nr:ABC transporter permease [Pararhizobium sp. IMCC21322]
MQDIQAAFLAAFNLIVSLDADLFEIVGLSLTVTLSAVGISCLLGFPLGALLAISRFPGRGMIVVFISSLMGLPPVVVGLTVYLFLSGAGPLGSWQLLYTPTAMIIAQTLLVTPIVAALTRQIVEDLNGEYSELLRSMSARRRDVLSTLLWDARYSLITAALAGMGRALAEVGAVMIVGGNINHVTRVMTTAIALETSKGELALALGLGIILVLLSISINAALMSLRTSMERFAYA